jgi:medium-chain acyl-[acyl-carrier-protein] hydrolase
MFVSDKELESQRICKIIKGKNTNRSVLIFHHAGGNSASYSRIVKPLTDYANLVLVDLPGRLNDSETIHLGQFLLNLKEEIKELLDDPVIIFGHSMGAVTGFEFALHLIDQGMAVEKLQLVLSGYRAPYLEFKVKGKKISQISAEEFNAYFGESPLIPEEIKKHKDFFDYFMKILRRDLHFLETYQYQKSPPVPLNSFLFIPMKDSLAPKKDQLLWSNIFLEPPKVKYFDGDHFYLFEKPGPFVDKLIDITKNT